METDERALAFDCRGEWLYGILSMPPAACSRGVLIVVGGPQYRAGSHRQFTLLARHLARNGIAAMRFDYRGMGDSQGEARDFEAVEDDLRAAVDAFTQAVPGMREVVLWGLCDAASAITMYAAGDSRVSGLVLLNPWIRTDSGIARTTLKHYYRARLLEGDFWRKLLRGRFQLRSSLAAMAALARKALAAHIRPDAVAGASLPERMRAGLQAFQGQVLLIISGADLTAREFCDHTSADRAWTYLLDASRVSKRQINNADHTFSSSAWRDQVADWTCDWIVSW